MPPNRVPMSLTSSIVQADDTRLQSCADFRRKWTPTEFCRLSLSKRTTTLLKLLANSDPVFIVPVDGGYNFATEYTPIHGAMPLLYDFNTNKQIAREACEVFYQCNTFILFSCWLPHVLQDQTDTWIMRETIQPRLLLRNLRIILNDYEPPAVDSTLMELANLLACKHLDRLEIEIHNAGNLAIDPEIIREQSINKAIALSVVIRQLREKFGMALKVLIGGPFAGQGKEDITWMWDRSS